MRAETTNPGSPTATDAADGYDNFAPDVFEPEDEAADPYDDPYAGRFDAYLESDDTATGEFDNFAPDVFEEEDDSWDPIDDSDRDLWGPEAEGDPDERRNRHELAGRAVLGGGALHEPDIHRVPADELSEAPDDYDFDGGFATRRTPSKIMPWASGGRGV